MTVRRSRILGGLVTVFTVFVCGCGKSGDGGGGGGNDIFVPDLSAEFQNQVDPDDRFFFLTDNLPEPPRAAAFTGNENNDVTPSHFTFSGAFQDRSIHFTYDDDIVVNGSKAGLVYTGTIDTSSTKITLNGSGGALVLVKQ